MGEASTCSGVSARAPTASGLSQRALVKLREAMPAQCRSVKPCRLTSIEARSAAIVIVVRTKSFS